MIVAAALRLKTAPFTIFTGITHYLAIHNSPPGTAFKDVDQGFIDHDWKFLTREEAAEVAWNSGQIQKYEKGQILLSEELTDSFEFNMNPSPKAALRRIKVELNNRKALTSCDWIYKIIEKGLDYEL